MRPILFATLLIFGGCTCGSQNRVDLDANASKREDETSQRQPKPSIYDAEGNLRESDETAGGLRLPMGVEKYTETEYKTVYRSEASTEKLLAYLGPKLTTGKVERVGDGAIYYDATVRGLEGTGVKITVSVLPGERYRYVHVLRVPAPKAGRPTRKISEEDMTEYFRSLD